MSVCLRDVELLVRAFAPISLHDEKVRSRLSGVSSYTGIPPLSGSYCCSIARVLRVTAATSSWVMLHSIARSAISAYVHHECFIVIPTIVFCIGAGAGIGDCPV
jgi:hypothetical protein